MVLGKARHAVTSRVLAARALCAGVPPDVDWCAAFTSADLAGFASVFRTEGDRFAQSCSALHHGEFVSHGRAHNFGSPAVVHWGQPVTGEDDSRWQHDLAYFFFAIPLMAADPERGIRTLASLVDALDAQLSDDRRDIRRFHWAPIAVAARTLALTTALALAPRDVLSRNRPELSVIGAHLWRAAEFLAVTAQRYLGYNHAALTEAGLAVGRLVQGRTDSAHQSVRTLVRMLERDTLRDGMWAERTPTYHLHMLVVAEAMRALADPSERRRLTELVARMRAALGAVVHPDGEIAILNDAAIGDAPSPAALGWHPAQAAPESVLPAGGYARIERAATVVIMDAGPMGPDAAIGHGHADFLSVEASIAGHRFIVDPGVASIAAGPDRQWTRSAHSHNGPTLDGREPAEFFGAYRVGRRGTAWFDTVAVDPSDAVSITGRCDGYRRWGVTVSRTIRLDHEGRLSIRDRWDGPSHPMSVSFLVSGIWTLDATSERCARFRHPDGTEVALAVAGGSVCRTEPARHFPTGPGTPQPATLLMIRPSRDAMTTTITSM